MTDHEWEIIEGPTEVSPSDVDSTLYRFTLKRGDEERSIIVAISNTLMASEPETLYTPIDTIVASKGEMAVRDYMAHDRIPKRASVTSNGLIEDYDDQ